MQSSARLKCDKIDSMLSMKNARAKTARSVPKLEKNPWCFHSFASFIQQGNFTQDKYNCSEFYNALQYIQYVSVYQV